MLSEIMFKEVVAKLQDEDEADAPSVRLGLKPEVDTVVVNMYRRTIAKPDPEQGELAHTTGMRVLVDSVTEDKRDSVLAASITIDKGDLIDAVAYISGTSDRIRTRADVEEKVIEERNKNLPLTLAETTGKEANKRFEKLYAEFEQTAADLRETQAQLSAAKQMVEMLKEQARAEGLSPDIEVTEIDLTDETGEEFTVEEIVPVGAPGDAEDAAT